MLFSLAPGEGGRLSFVGPLGFFQLASEVVIFFSQPLLFTLQPFSFTLPLFALPPQCFIFFAQPFILLARRTPSLPKLLDLAFPLAQSCGEHRTLFPQLTLTKSQGFVQP